MSSSALEEYIDFANLLNWVERRPEPWAKFRNFSKSHIRSLKSHNVFIDLSIGWDKRRNPRRVLNETILKKVLDSIHAKEEDLTAKKLAKELDGSYLLSLTNSQ